MRNVSVLGWRLGKWKRLPPSRIQKAAIFSLAFALSHLGHFSCGQNHGGASGAFREGVVPLDETARAANHEQAHEFAPIVRVAAFFKRGQTIDRALMATGKFIRAAVTVALQVFLGPDVPTHVVGDSWNRRSWFAEVEVGFVVRRGGKKDALAGVAREIIANGCPTTAFAIPQVVAFINDDDTVAAEIGQFVLRLRDGNHLGNQAVTVGIILPHTL